MVEKNPSVPAEFPEWVHRIANRQDAMHVVLLRIAFGSELDPKKAAQQCLERHGLLAKTDEGAS